MNAILAMITRKVLQLLWRRQKQVSAEEVRKNEHVNKYGFWSCAPCSVNKHSPVCSRCFDSGGVGMSKSANVGASNDCATRAGTAK